MTALALAFVIAGGAVIGTGTAAAAVAPTAVPDGSPAAGFFAALPKDLNLSAAGLEYILTWEGFRASPYDDATGNCTIGSGHLIHRGLCTDPDRLQWGTITRDQARYIAYTDITSRIVPAIRTGIPNTPLFQHQFDTLVDWIYNVGPGYITGQSGVRAALLAVPTGYDDVPAALMAYVYSGKTKLCGLYRRRIGDATLWRTAAYASNRAPCPQDAL
ncbi:lysozyme [Frankia sp. R82]|uniref:lysozyme n=1 Tax=Frankia sp. R82 TaxID=2950553 RepID=UPI002044B84F|nr:lysozyme [Frankia sp. R82]MCM3885232.1 lysozyme [Frankia sp. R82]